MAREMIVVTSQKEPFNCCRCGVKVSPYEMFMSTGCHIDCGGKHYFRPFPKEKPKLGETVLVFEQGYGIKNNYFCSYAVARYIKSPYDGRKKVFANELHVNTNQRQPWIYHNVTHFMTLCMPEQIKNPGVAIIPNDD